MAQVTSPKNQSKHTEIFRDIRDTLPLHHEKDQYDHQGLSKKDGFGTLLFALKIRSAIFSDPMIR